jgi:N-acetyl-gamma-glutamylphosphate reductase
MQLYAPTSTTPKRQAFRAPVLASIDGLRLGILENGKLNALALNDTNQLEIRVFANEEARQAVVIARLDNLGKGASGAAVQNIQLMLGL